jgi:hypothetical protein
MPVRETMELAQTLREQGFPLDNIAINKWLPRVFADPGSLGILQRLTDDPSARLAFEHAAAGRAPIAVGPWLDALNLVAAQRAEAQEYLVQLRSLPGTKFSIVPYIPDSSRRLLRVAEAMRSPPEAFV